MYGWTDDEASYYYSVLSGIFLVGMMVGALLSGKLMALSRIKLIMFTNIVFVVGGLLNTVKNIYILGIVRLAFGFSNSFI